MSNDLINKVTADIVNANPVSTEKRNIVILEIPPADSYWLYVLKCKEYAETCSKNATITTEQTRIAITEASNAATSAQTATTKAEEAITAVQTATSKAIEAQNAASSANTSAQTATTKAEEASISASQASTSATNAVNSANAASKSATSAAQNASQASTSAEEARKVAESIGNPVVDVLEVGGTVTVKKSDGQTNTFKTFSIDMVYPIGAIYMSTVVTSPAILFGGTWEALPAGRVLLAQGLSTWGTSYSAGSTGGEATHKLTTAEIPAHNHTASAKSTTISGHTAVMSGDSELNQYTDGAFSWSLIKGASNYSNGNMTLAKLTFSQSIAPSISVNNAGSGTAHNNMQPYLSVYMWKRTA